MGQVIAHDEEFEAEARILSPEEWTVYWPQISVQLDTIPQWWEPYWTKDFINSAVMSQGWQAWGFGDYNKVNLIVLTQIIIYPGARVLQMMLAFGNNLAMCAPLIDASLFRFAMEAECEYAEIVGREGWVQYFPRFRKVGVVLRCEIQRVGVH